ncbi:7047_t:CDS:2 [Acaulospora morrowiae]|uniref:Rhomboid-type serine protease n=1 Tax=Acaulospora morrowiae TaxID=94023 RepID=A0A9N9ADU5_9GLOM|nr:7047_t:CDS:2 [Acaulospora morrowiae]
MSKQSGWNKYFHQDQAYDTTYKTSQPIPSYDENQPSQRLSYFAYTDDYIPAQNTDSEKGISEKAVDPTDPSFWDTSHNATTSRELTEPSAPPASVGDMEETPQNSATIATQYGNLESEETYESDEAVARRVLQEEQEQLHRQGLSSRYFPPGESESYYAAYNQPEASTRSGGPPPPSTYNEKAIDDSYVQNQMAKKTVWRPYFTWVVTFVQLIMLIYEFIDNKNLTGELIETNPFNPMIGPGTATLIQLGARFVPCMKPNVTGISSNALFECPNTGSTGCTLEQLCALGGFKSGQPDQWYRFITPIFLHAGIVHYALNMVFQVFTGAQVESDMGWWRYSIIYMASGIFGFIFGGNFSSPTIPTMGASGSLFGVVGVILLELLQSWKIIRNPCWELTKLLAIIIISFLVGLLPFFDNFSHIGGFLMGLITGCVLNPTINFSKFHKRANWIIRIVALPISVLLFYLLIHNFYTTNPSESCPWCKYLSCLPVNGWCDNTGLTNTTQTN